jgi:hypothetical protein
MEEPIADYPRIVIMLPPGCIARTNDGSFAWTYAIAFPDANSMQYLDDLQTRLSKIRYF